MKRGMDGADSLLLLVLPFFSGDVDLLKDGGLLVDIGGELSKGFGVVE